MFLLELNMQMAILIMVVLVFRKLLLNQFPRKVFTVLWLLIISRLLWPAYLTSSLSLYSIIELVSGQSIGSLFEISLTSMQSEMEVVLSVSMMVTLLLLLSFCIAYIHNRRRLRHTLPCHHPNIRDWQVQNSLILRKIRIFTSDKVYSPLTYGIFRPVIILPETLSLDNRRLLGYILKHEYKHITRLDSLWKLLALITACLYWYNPFVWLILIYFPRDLEMSCDASVLQWAGVPQRAEYARSLMAMAANDNAGSRFQNSFSKNVAKERIISVMKYKKSGPALIIISIIFVLIIFAMFGADANHPLINVA